MSTSRPGRLLVLGLGWLGVAACSTPHSEDRLRRQGDEVVAKIEQFRRDSSRLPRSLAAVGFDEKESGPIHYEPRGEARYVVWFGTTLGESVIYDSETRTWDPPPRR